MHGVRAVDGIESEFDSFLGVSIIFFPSYSLNLPPERERGEKKRVQPYGRGKM